MIHIDYLFNDHVYKVYKYDGVIIYYHKSTHINIRYTPHPHDLVHILCINTTQYRKYIYIYILIYGRCKWTTREVKKVKLQSGNKQKTNILIQFR